MAGPALFRPSNITSGLVGYWKLDEASGSRADSSGNGYTLTDNNTVMSAAQDYWKSGDNSADFEASNSEYLSRTDTDALDFAGSSFTFVCWFKPESLGAANGLISKTNWAPTNGYYFYTPAGDTRISIVLNGTTYSSNTGAVASGKWSHLAAVRDVSAGTISLYVDGNLFYTSTSAVTLAGNANNFEIGRHGTAGSEADGLMKDAAVWNVALTPIQIKSLALGVDLSTFAYRPNNVSTAPTAWWKLNEISSGAGAVSRVDSGANGLTLTDTNTVVTAGGYAEGTSAKFVQTDGDYLGCADNVLLDATGSYSISFWMNTTLFNGDRSIISKYNGTNGWVLFHSTGTGWRVRHETTSYTISATDFTPVNGTWYHYAVVFDASADTIKFYIDGVLNQITSSVTVDPTDNSAQFRLSADAGGLNVGITSNLADVGWWKGYTLTSAEVASLACGIPLQQTGLVSYWKLDETSGNRADSIGVNSLTDNNTVLYAAGKVSNSADFEAGNSESLSITNGAQVGLEFATDLDSYTLLAWIKPETGVAFQSIFSMDHTNQYNLCVGSAASTLTLYHKGATSSTVSVLANATWTHIVGLWDGAFAKTFANSALGNSTANSGVIANTSNNFYIGDGTANGFGGAFFDGLIDEALIAKRWFRDEEIKTIYCKGLAGKELTSQELVSVSASGNFFLLF